MCVCCAVHCTYNAIYIIIEFELCLLYIWNETTMLYTVQRATSYISALLIYSYSLIFSWILPIKYTIQINILIAFLHIQHFLLHLVYNIYYIVYIWWYNMIYWRYLCSAYRYWMLIYFAIPNNNNKIKWQCAHGRRNATMRMRQQQPYRMRKRNIIVEYKQRIGFVYFTDILPFNCSRIDENAIRCILLLFYIFFSSSFVSPFYTVFCRYNCVLSLLRLWFLHIGWKFHNRNVLYLELCTVLYVLSVILCRCARVLSFFRFCVFFFCLLLSINKSICTAIVVFILAFI